MRGILIGVAAVVGLVAIGFGTLIVIANGMEPTREMPADPGLEPTAQMPSDPGLEPTAQMPVDPGLEPTAQMPADPGLEPTAQMPADAGLAPTSEMPIDPGLDPTAEMSVSTSDSGVNAELTDSIPIDIDALNDALSAEDITTKVAAAGGDATVEMPARPDEDGTGK